jgi:DNA (cytosine-5)-methyltransferase 1
MKPRLLDLFCGAGGCSVGYARAGFDVVGVDIAPQPNYPFEFVQADALDLLDRIVYQRGREADAFIGRSWEAIHASPPCQHYSVANNIHGRTDHPDLIGPTRDLLEAIGLPYVIENVPGAPMIPDRTVTVCGLSLGLNVKRHRLFESNVPLMVPPCHSSHAGDWLLVFGHTVLERGHVIRETPAGNNTTRRKHTTTERGREAMGIDWMRRDELSQAIPPAYTELIGHQLLAHSKASAA